jgi:3-methyladenine DNA glycosylase AlkD
MPAVKKFSKRKENKITNSIHLQILKDILKLKSNSDLKETQWVQNYLGSNKPTKGFSASDVKKFAKNIVDNNALDQNQLIDLLNSLYQNAVTFNEIDIAARILGVKPQFCRNLDPNVLDNWLNYTYGWAETDLLCQSNFDSKMLLSNWSEWEKILKQFNQDPNIHKRRASLVLLTKPLRDSADLRLSELAFANIENLKSEKEILITKAVSWLLRSLVKFHRPEVKIYLEKNQDSLPKIAYREAFAKLTTGKKYNRKNI